MIQEIRIEEERWDEIVKSFSHYDVFYLKHYGEAFWKEGYGEPILIYAEVGNTRAINVIMKRDIAEEEAFKGKIEKGIYFDICSPYGYGGFLVEGNEDEFHKILEEYEVYCQTLNYISEFVRFELLEPYYKWYYGEIETRTHNVVRNLEIPIEDILADFEYKVRKNLKTAIKNGLEIMLDKEGNYLEEFLRIYYGTMDRTNADKNFYFSKEFFKRIHKLKENFVYFHVLYENKIISSELILYGSENAYSYLGGTDSNYFSVRPNDFLKYEIIKWLKEKNLKNFILGGGYGADDGIFRYKKSLAPNGIVDFYIGKRIIQKKRYEELLEIRKRENNFSIKSSFFPLYRA